MTKARRFLFLFIAAVLAVGGLGYGFARAAEPVPDTTAALQEGGSGWLGVAIEDSDDGVVIRQVTADSPAEAAELPVDGIITAVDNIEIESAQGLVDLITGYAPGDEVTITVEVDGEATEYTVTLGERPAALDAGPAQPHSDDQRPGRRNNGQGVVIGGILNVFGLDAQMTDAGLEVQSVDADSPFAEAGLQAGDVVTAINGEDVLTSRTGALALSINLGEPVTLTVLRDNEELSIEVDLSDFAGSFAGGMMDDFDLPGGFGLDQMVSSLLGVEAELTDEGLAITSISDDSPLAESDFQEGDVITAVNDFSLADFQPGAMMDLFGELEPGATLTVTVLRDGEEMTIDVEVPESLDFQFSPMGPGFGFGQDNGRGQGFGPGMMAARPTQLGVQFVIVTPEIAEERDLPVDQGALIEMVYEDTPAAQAGLQAGDIVTAVEGDPVDERRTLSERLLAYQEGEVVELTVLRDGDEMSLDVTLGARGAGFGFDMPHGMMDYFFGPDGMPNEDFFRNHPFLSPDDMQPDQAQPKEDVPTGPST